MIDLIRALPEAPASWILLETAPADAGLDDLPDIGEVVSRLVESARSRIVFESYFLRKSLGTAAKRLLAAPADGIHVLGVVHPNPMSDAPFLAELRRAGAHLIERDVAPIGGSPKDGYIHAKFIIVDGRRGYLGSANLSAAGMRSNREMGIYFEDARVAQALELMAGFDAGHISDPPPVNVRSALIVQGGADEFLMDGLPRCEEGVAALCEMAQKEIDVMMFTFSHQFGRYDAIAGPLRSAVRRGVKVRLIHDAGVLKEIPAVVPTLRDMKQWGIDVRIADFSDRGEDEPSRYHAKAMRVDDEFLMVGSNNWTDDASYENRESAIILRSRRLAEQFRRRFNADWHAGGGVKPFYD